MTPITKKDHVSDVESLPWCNALLTSPSYTLSPVVSRQLPDDSKQHTLFGLTLHTSSTIRAVINLWHEGQTSTSQSHQTISDNPSPSRLPLRTENELTMLVSLGPQLTSHPGILHGGICVMLMDEAVAFFVLRELNMESGIGSGIYTKSLEVTYSRSVKTPNVVRVRAWKNPTGLRDGEIWGTGRRMWTNACIQDGEGRVLVEGRYLFGRAGGKL